MSFVEMVDRDLETERLQDTRPRNSEDNFLFETIGLIAAVEMMSDLAVIGPILIEIGVEQQHRDAMSEGAGEAVEPRAYPDLAPFDCHCNHGIEWIHPSPSAAINWASSPDVRADRCPAVHSRLD